MSIQPNILWIVTTQWRASAMGYSGDPNARTPWLDGLASESVNYTQAVSPHPFGPQARAALLTGKQSPQNGVADYWDTLPVDVRTVAHALKDRGYETAFFGKWHLFKRDKNLPFVGEAHAKIILPSENRGGFEFWEGFESGFLLNNPWLHGTRLPVPRLFSGYQADVVIQRAAEWIKSPHKRPIFCVVSLEAPHPPYHAPTPHVADRKPEEVELGANVPRGDRIEKQARQELAGYYGHIEATDRSIGKLMTEVSLSNTAVVFTSVHGDMHGAHGLFRKGWPYEESVRVPLLIKNPLTNKKGMDDSLVSLIDLPHMAVAWSLGKEWACKRRDHALISMPVATTIPLQCDRAWRGFRTPSYKFIVNANGSPWLYFDLKNDPWEMQNLIGDPSRDAEIKRLQMLI